MRVHAAYMHAHSNLSLGCCCCMVTLRGLLGATYHWRHCGMPARYIVLIVMALVRLGCRRGCRCAAQMLHDGLACMVDGTVLTKRLSFPVNTVPGSCPA